MSDGQCSAYRADKTICANGFFQRPGCRAHQTCHACGRDSDPKWLPYCLRDELPEHWITETGTPAFYRERDSHA